MANRLIANSVSEKPFDKMNNQGRQADHGQTCSFWDILTRFVGHKYNILCIVRIDESFRLYIPLKPPKFGVKFW